MDYSQVGLPKFLDKNDKCQAPHEIMTKLEATKAELERVHAKCATSQVQFKELSRTNFQI